VRCKSEDLKELMILHEKKKIERVLFVFTGKALWFGLISRITLTILLQFLISILTCTLDSVPYTREKPLLIRRCCSCVVSCYWSVSTLAVACCYTVMLYECLILESNFKKNWNFFLKFKLIYFLCFPTIFMY
jgi:hypothetical protein